MALIKKKVTENHEIRPLNKGALHLTVLGQLLGEKKQNLLLG